jgi:hypothetical protein
VHPKEATASSPPQREGAPNGRSKRERVLRTVYRALALRAETPVNNALDNSLDHINDTEDNKF